MRIICITQVKHLDGVYEKLFGCGDVIYEPEINRDTLKVMLEVFEPEYLFTNPNKQPFILDEGVLKDSNIKVINTCSTGTNHIDMKYCKENNIEVWHLAKDYELINQLPSTAEHAFGLMLSLIRKIPMSFHSVKDGNWDYEPYIGRQLKGLTVGIIGYGRLGKMMETYCHAFGMTVKIHDPYEGYDDLDLVLRESDVISLHVHVTGKTVGMINGNTIKRMKKKPYLINTSRGEIVYEKKVIEAIEEGKLSGYATDVITDEFGNIHNSKLVEFSMNPNRNVIITPHVGGMTWEGQTKAYKWAVRKFENI